MPRSATGPHVLRRPCQTSWQAPGSRPGLDSCGPSPMRCSRGCDRRACFLRPSGSSRDNLSAARNRREFDRVAWRSALRITRNPKTSGGHCRGPAEASSLLDQQHLCAAVTPYESRGHRPGARTDDQEINRPIPGPVLFSVRRVGVGHADSSESDASVPSRKRVTRISSSR